MACFAGATPVIYVLGVIPGIQGRGCRCGAGSIYLVIYVIYLLGQSYFVRFIN